MSEITDWWSRRQEFIDAENRKAQTRYNPEYMKSLKDESNLNRESDDPYAYESGGGE